MKRPCILLFRCLVVRISIVMVTLLELLSIKLNTLVLSNWYIHYFFLIVFRETCFHIRLREAKTFLNPWCSTQLKVYSCQTIIYAISFLEIFGPKIKVSILAFLYPSFAILSWIWLEHYSIIICFLFGQYFNG